MAYIDYKNKQSSTHGRKDNQTMLDAANDGSVPKVPMRLVTFSSMETQVSTENTNNHFQNALGHLGQGAWK